MYRDKTVTYRILWGFKVIAEHEMFRKAKPGEGGGGLSLSASEITNNRYRSEKYISVTVY
jgi:hypothetical protein